MIRVLIFWSIFSPIFAQSFRQNEIIGISNTDTLKLNYDWFDYSEEGIQIYQMNNKGKQVLEKIQTTDANKVQFELLDFDQNGIKDLVLLAVDEEYFHIDIILFNYDDKFLVKQHFTLNNLWIVERYFEPDKKWFGLLRVFDSLEQNKIVVYGQCENDFGTDSLQIYFSKDKVFSSCGKK